MDTHGCQREIMYRVSGKSRLAKGSTALDVVSYWEAPGYSLLI